MENLVAYYGGRGLDVVVARPFNHIGPGQKEGFLLPDLVTEATSAAADGRPMRVGDLTTSRDYTDVRDVARAYRLLLEAELGPDFAADRVFNVCSGRARSGDELCDLALAELGLAHLERSVDESRIRPNDPTVDHRRPRPADPGHRLGARAPRSRTPCATTSRSVWRAATEVSPLGEGDAGEPAGLDLVAARPTGAGGEEPPSQRSLHPHGVVGSERRRRALGALGPAGHVDDVDDAFGAAALGRTVDHDAQGDEAVAAGQVAQVGCGADASHERHAVDVAGGEGCWMLSCSVMDRSTVHRSAPGQSRRRGCG